MKSLVSFAALTLSVSAAAELPQPPIPHNPILAKCELQRIVAAIDARDRSKLPANLRIVSEKVGIVEDNEFETFFNEFEAESPKLKKLALELTHIGYVEINGVSPLYAITLRRGGGDGAFWSTWTVQFKSDEVVLMRRADEFWPFADNKVFLTYNDCGSLKANG